jgi:hypothetical protein
MTIDGINAHQQSRKTASSWRSVPPDAAWRTPASASAAAPTLRASNLTPASTNASPVANLVSTAPRSCCYPFDDPLTTGRQPAAVSMWTAHVGVLFLFWRTPRGTQQFREIAIGTPVIYSSGTYCGRVTGKQPVVTVQGRTFTAETWLKVAVTAPDGMTQE